MQSGKVKTPNEETKKPQTSNIFTDIRYKGISGHLQ